MPTKPGRPIVRPTEIAEQEDQLVSRPQFAENYPSLYRFLAQNRENDKFHATGCITIFWEDQVFKVSLNDRPTGRSTFVSHEELRSAFLIADRGLRSHTLRWRPNKQYRARAKNLNA